MNGGQNVVKDYYIYDLRIMLFHNASFSFLLLLEKTNTFFLTTLTGNLFFYTQKTLSMNNHH